MKNYQMITLLMARAIDSKTYKAVEIIKHYTVGSNSNRPQIDNEMRAWLKWTNILKCPAEKKLKTAGINKSVFWTYFVIGKKGKHQQDILI